MRYLAQGPTATRACALITRTHTHVKPSSLPWRKVDLSFYLKPNPEPSYALIDFTHAHESLRFDHSDQIRS